MAPCCLLDKGQSPWHSLQNPPKDIVGRQFSMSLIFLHFLHTEALTNFVPKYLFKNVFQWESLESRDNDSLQSVGEDCLIPSIIKTMSFQDKGGDVGLQFIIKKQTPGFPKLGVPQLWHQPTGWSIDLGHSTLSRQEKVREGGKENQCNNEAHDSCAVRNKVLDLWHRYLVSSASIPVTLAT